MPADAVEQKVWKALDGFAGECGFTVELFEEEVLESGNALGHRWNLLVAG